MSEGNTCKSLKVAFTFAGKLVRISRYLGASASQRMPPPILMRELHSIELLIKIHPSDVGSISSLSLLSSYCASQDDPGVEECSLHEYDQGQTPDTRVPRSKKQDNC